jgi:hypothetical protein
MTEKLWRKNWKGKPSSVNEAPDGSSAIVSRIVHCAPIGRHYYCVTEKGLLPETKFSCIHHSENINYDPATKTWSGTFIGTDARSGQSVEKRWTISVERETVEIETIE